MWLQSKLGESSVFEVLSKLSLLGNGAFVDCRACWEVWCAFAAPGTLSLWHLLDSVCVLDLS